MADKTVVVSDQPVYQRLTCEIEACNQPTADGRHWDS
jgi:hypothetical protein